MLLKGKSAVITGSNRGIGRAVLQVFAENGASLFACARKETAEFSETLRSIVASTGAIIQPVFFDLNREEEVKSAIQVIVGSEVPIDALVNNAAVAAGGFFQMTSMKDMKGIFDVNFFSQIQFTQGLSRHMARAKRGSIINIGSTAGLIGQPGTISYGSSKAALMFATKTMASELGASNVRVNAIAPGVTKTEMFDQMDEKSRLKQIESAALKRPAEAREIADVALFLASDLSAYVTGQVLRVDGGMTG